ncbi:MAG TPA: hypothetical protein VH020_13000 [Stellaceae bacterium]|jgi:hypothetical protein|nr:hypothetical protein [Stellaceae bacterium]
MLGLLRAAVSAQELRLFYDSARAKARRLVVALVAGAIAGIFALAAVIWLDIALWFYCEPRLGAPISALIAAGALLLVALLALIPLALTSARPRPRRAVAMDAPTAAALHDVAELVKRNKGAVIIAAALAGLVLGTKRR